MKDLKKYVAICMKELDAIHVPYGKVAEARVNTRAKRRWGQCRMLPNGLYSIEVNAALLDEKSDDTGLKNTIIHELLHTCPNCMNHGENWKRWAEAVNNAYGYNIKRCSSSDEKGVAMEARVKPRYIVRCSC